MNLRNWSADAFAQDTWRLTQTTTLDFGLRYEFETPLADISRPWSNLEENGKLMAFIGGQDGMPRGLMYPNKLRFAPRWALRITSSKAASCFAPPTASSTLRWI
jgi:outer membrane receptor protein involved in Fe transport